MGFYSRAAVVSGPGTWLGDGEAIPDLGDVHRNWSQIDSLKGAQTYDDANAALMDMLTGPRETPQESEEEAEEPAEGEAMTVQGVFDRLPDAFQPEAAAGLDVVFQFSISGPGGGDWHVAIKEGQCTVETGVHRVPTTTLKMSDEDFLRYVGGQLPAMQAYTTGKLKIQGDLMKSQLVEKLFKFR
jgi:putative sterol carrier protein